MLQIRDAALCDQVPTPVTFFIEPSLTECCDLPCGCVFSTCEYWQDFGNFMYQITLDGLKIKTFTVDGINVIDSPVGFGIIKNVNVSGRPFVSNLVDTLNSIGASYMTFAYGQRLDAQKGARFFTIKRPACLPFEIIIGTTEDDLYRYTETSQEQKVFSLNYEPLGYSSPIGVPENCITTKEY